MARLTADTVTRQLKKIFGDKMTLALESKTSEKVDFIVTYNKNNAQIKAFFDLQSQLYGFIMFNKGIKTYDKVEVFAEMLDVYMYINTELIPITQQIVDLYSRENGLTTKYMTFTGNLNEGFTTQFEVAGEPRFVFVTEQETNVYRLTLVESHDKKKYKTLDMYLYLRQADGTFEKRFMILSAANKLFERCFDLGEDYALKRTETNSFVFSYGDLTVDFSLNITDVIEYDIHGVNGQTKEFSFVLDDFLDIDAFITAVLDRIGGKLSSSQGPQMPSYDNAENTSEDVDAVSMDDIEFEDAGDDATDIDKEMNDLDTAIDMSDDVEPEETDDTVTEDDTTDTDDLFDANDENGDMNEEPVEDSADTDVAEMNDEESDTVSEDELNFEDTDIFEESTVDKTDDLEKIEDSSYFEESDLATEEKEPEMGAETEIQETTEPTPVDNEQVEITEGQNIVLSKLNRDGNLVGLLFNVDGKLYIANIESLKDYHIPYGRLTNSEVEVQKKGYAVWESESRLKTFADDISDNAALIKQLYEMMF